MSDGVDWLKLNSDLDQLWRARQIAQRVANDEIEVLESAIEAANQSLGHFSFGMSQQVFDDDPFVEVIVKLSHDNSGFQFPIGLEVSFSFSGQTEIGFRDLPKSSTESRTTGTIDHASWSRQLQWLARHNLTMIANRRPK